MISILTMLETVVERSEAIPELRLGLLVHAPDVVLEGEHHKLTGVLTQQPVVFY